MKQTLDFDIVVIGGGIVGLASAYQIADSHPDVRLAVLEKEDRLAAHQTGHNSDVIHSGLYYKPGSSKAKTCAQGRKELISFAKKYHIPYEICGKVIVATQESELGNLDYFFQNGLENNIEGIERIGSDEIKEIKGQTNKVLTSHEVTAFDKHDFYTNVVTNNGDFSTNYIINCAGLQSDRIARMDGINPGVRIVPFRGDYYELTEQAREKVKNLIYPVPDPDFPFLGVHFTRKIDGSVECGPNAVLSFKREGYGKTDFSLTDTWESLTYWGTWRLFMRHWRYGLGEYTRAFCKKLFLRQLQKLIPSLNSDDITPGVAGVRAQALGPKGQLIDDFKIERCGNSIHVLNAPSPAATASLAIGEYIKGIATEHFKL